jgi:hypothetical protein
MGRAEVGTARLGPQFGLHINLLLQQDAFQEGVLVTEHETLISCVTMSRLQVVKVGLMHADSLL